jgi:precorrin-3B synthase
MLTGDGLLMRLAPTDAMSLDAFVALCAAACAHGNGIMEVTARGSLQVRGLRPGSALLFAAEVGALGIGVNGRVAVLTGPLTDDAEAIIDASGLAAELRQAIAQAGLTLAPKVSVVVDGGGPLHLDALSADIRLRAIGSPVAPRLQIALGALLPLPLAGEGRAGGTCGMRNAYGKAVAPLATLPPEEGGGSSAWFGAIALEQAVDVVLGVLKEIAAHGPAARGTDVIRARGIEAIRSQFDIAPAAAPALRPPAEMVGQHLLRDRSLALGIALAFGHAQADALAELTRIAAAHGVRAIGPAPDRALMLIGVPPTHASDLVAAAEQLGFVVSAADPRRRIAACPGAPACASGFIDARRIAAALAPQLAGLRNGIAIHVSGCAKGCAHPTAAALTVVGAAQGCGIIRNSTARATPSYYVAPSGLATEVARAFAASEAGHG